MKSCVPLAVLRIFIVLTIEASGDLIARSYTYQFLSTENPLSDSGSWLNGKTDGLDWSDVAVTNSMAIGLQSGINPNYDDSTAVVSGTWGSNQTVTATVRIPGDRPPDGNFPELEIRLRTSISAHRIAGYEVIFSVPGGYAQLVRWNGPVNDFTYIASGNGIYLQDGDVIKATVSNNVFTSYVNGVQILQASDNTFTTGSPGIGMFIQGTTGLNNLFGFSNFSASDGESPAVTNGASLNIVLPKTKGSYTLVQSNAVPRGKYRVQYSDQIFSPNWQTLSTVTANNFGVVQYTDTVTNGAPWRFYRTISP